jgi:non-heme chloroperoxidase
MGTITTTDGTQIFYKDWGSGQLVVFSHGWPLNADAWDDQAMLVANNGYRAIAHDRRAHGRSSQPWTGHELDTYAADLAQLIEQLDLREVVLVGHSTGGGEVTRYLGRHGTTRVARRGRRPFPVLQGPEHPLLWGQPARLQRLPRRPGRVLAVEHAGRLKGAYDCIKAFSETDLTQDLQRIDVPTLLIHGDDDQIVPVDASARRSVELVPHATLKEYPGAPHGLFATHKDEFNTDLLDFLNA